MWVSTQAFHVAKKGSSEREYEDACYPDDRFDGERISFRCAVADGASESAFSGEWARLLVSSFGKYQFHLEEQQRLWRVAVEQKPLPWYLESKVTHGAHAAFVGLSLRDPWPDNVSDLPLKGSWLALAVGDSCLFHVRDEELLTAGPVGKSDEFSSNPLLLSTTHPSPIKRDDPLVSVMRGTWVSNDTFYLATDALAQWLLSEEEASRPPWVFLRDLGPTLFASLVPILRGTGRLHNDDTTLIRLAVR